MKKMILIGIIVAAAIGGMFLMRNRCGMMGFCSFSSSQEVDLVVVNDSSDTISSEYTKVGKEVAQVINPGSEVTGGRGFIRIFIAKKPGSYELMYAFPRPADSPQKVTLSQIIASVQKKELSDELYTETGMIGDIKVQYEEAREME